MLSKVAKRVRRRSVQPPVQPDAEPWIEVRGEIVQNAPDLVRWTNILGEPFPRVAMGGYSRYYASTSSSKFPPSPPFCPALSQFPEASPSTLIPSSSPLFSTAVKQQRLTVIHEVSTESIAFTHPRTVSVCTTTNGSGPGPGSSLRRKRRQLLRTPSIERDFAVNARHLLLPSLNISDNDHETSSIEVPTSHGGGSTHSHSYSTNSTNSTRSESSQSVSHISEDPLTPSTSVEGPEDGDVFRVARRLEEEQKQEDGVEAWMDTLKIVDPPKRPGSGTSFSTARTDFDEDMLPDDIEQGLSPLTDRS